MVTQPQLNPTPGEQVAFGAYEEPLKKQAAKKSHTFKIALVASDCLLLGGSCSVNYCMCSDCSPPAGG